MTKRLSCRLGIFIFKYDPHPLSVKSQHVTVRVGVNMHWLESDSLVIGRGVLEPSPIFF